MIIKTNQLCGAALLLCFTGMAWASSVALEFTGGSGGTVQNSMAGWRFDTIQSIQINALGVYDSTGTGLIDSHQVGIWDSGGNLLAEATIPSGSGATLIDNFRYVPISTLNLAAGQIFTVAAFYGPPDDAIISAFANITTDPRISYVDCATSLTTQFSDPINFNTLNLAGDFGPNFTMTAAAAPEPTTWLLLGIGISFLFAAGRRQEGYGSGLRCLSNHSSASFCARSRAS